MHFEKYCLVLYFEDWLSRYLRDFTKAQFLTLEIKLISFVSGSGGVVGMLAVVSVTDVSDLL
jgi:hypothetical protein